MSLRAYQQKRDFAKTAEPAGRAPRRSAGRCFVVQKHDASRLHYDFRLEMSGVLKSWAVPKGFPTKRGERHLAVQVEDHPLEYADFEGTIPAGEYGGGTVMVWDFGIYETVGVAGPKGLSEGKIHVRLAGKKLQGEWTLVQSSRSGDEQNWFLLKTAEAAAKFSKEQEEHSAKTGRTLAQIARGSAAEEPAEADTAAPKRTKAASNTRAAKPAASNKSKRARQSVAVTWVEPMKATLVAAPPPGNDWLYELKWDGYRALALKNGDDVQLVSRNQKPLTADFPEIVEGVRRLPCHTALLDGEICALDPQGRPTFQLLQAREMGQSRPPMFFYAFDLLQLEAESLLHQPLEQRKQALAGLLEEPPEAVRFSGAIEGEVASLLAEVRARGMEGLIGKRRESHYTPGTRSKEWVKLKVTSEQEFVIGGCTPPGGSRQYLGALLVGYYAEKEFRFAGKIGTGFNAAWLKRLHGLVTERAQDACPFVDLPKRGSGRWNQGLTAAEMRRCTWCRPELVCQVKFAEWTNDGSLRHPVFLGLRADKSAREVHREKPGWE